MNTPDNPSSGEYLQEGTNILLDAFEKDAVTDFLKLPRLLRRIIMHHYYETIVKSSLIMLKENNGKVKGICTYTIKHGESNKSNQISPLEKFIDIVTQGRYSQVGEFFQFMEELETKEMPGKHIYISQIGISQDSTGKGLGTSMVKDILSLGEKEKMGVWLYTVDATNIDFYKKCGFILLSSGKHPETQLAYWTFKKESTGQTQVQVNGRIQAILAS